jgi:DNA-binding NarL/FixJ family response regulator
LVTVIVAISYQSHCHQHVLGGRGALSPRYVCILLKRGMSIKLLVVDDHEIVRVGLKALLTGTDIKIVSEAASGDAAVRLALKQRPDVVLMDVRMADGDGLTALGRIKLDHPEMPIVMFSSFDNPNYVARAVALGASAYVLKGSSKERLVSVIRQAAEGDSVWTREELRRITGALAAPRLAQDVDVPLTQRESEVLEKLAMGYTNKEIAQFLKISYETVKEHVQHVLRKVGVTDRTQAAVWAARRGILRSKN